MVRLSARFPKGPSAFGVDLGNHAATQGPWRMTKSVLIRTSDHPFQWTSREVRGSPRRGRVGRSGSIVRVR